jgi:4-oxalocrotonate tautomerase
MPHVIVKLVTGRTEQQKADLSAEITKAIMACTRSREAAVSIAFEEVEKEDWVAAVYKPDILDKWETVLKKPGYDPFKTE